MTNHFQSLHWFFSYPHITFSVRFGALSVLAVSVLFYGLVLGLGVFYLPLLPAWSFIVWLSLFVFAGVWAFAMFPREKRWINRMNLALDELDFARVKDLIQQVDLVFLASPNFELKFGLLKVRYFNEQGDVLEAFQLLQRIKTKALLPKELCRVECALTFLLLEQGNFKAVRKSIVQLKSVGCEADEKARIFLLESRLLELSGNIALGKGLLEDGLVLPKIECLTKAVFLHQLALLETTQGNVQTALGYYNQAYSILVDFGHIKQMANTARNFIFLSLRLGDVVQAQSILAAFAEKINPNLAAQQILLHNMEIEFARQTGDRERLLCTYSKAEQILPLLDEQERFFFVVMGLPMHYNDDVDFETMLVKTMQVLVEGAPYDLRDVFHSYKTVLGVLRQAFTRLGARTDLLAYHGWIVMEWVRLQEYLDDEYHALPEALSALRSDWFDLSLEGVKLRLNLFGRGLPKTEFNKLFALLTERKRIWEDKENPCEQMQALVTIADEYLAYAKEIDGQQFKVDFFELVMKVLKEAKDLLQKNEAHPAFTQYFVGMAYFYSQFQLDRVQAKEWLVKFDAKGQSLNHYAGWFGEHYQVAKDWVDVGLSEEL